jgi:hypothetical protein
MNWHYSSIKLPRTAINSERSRRDFFIVSSSTSHAIPLKEINSSGKTSLQALL